MKHRIIIFFHALTIVLLQFIPDTIIVAYATPAGAVYYRVSFIDDFALLWGTGILWYPPITICSFISLCFAFVLLIWNRRWSKIAILSTSIPVFLLMLIPLFEMIKDMNRFSVVPVLIALLLIFEVILTVSSLSKSEKS